MTAKRILFAALALAAGLAIGSLNAYAGELPSHMSIASAAHEVTVGQVKQGLESLGFTNVEGIEKNGRIFEMKAMWEGREVDLRFNAESGRITAG
ncbi:MAG: hypothetical protein ACE5Q3_19165 [Alphaproteobacteria bacterium]